MASIGIESLDGGWFKICRFMRKAGRDKWVKEKANKRRPATDEPLDLYLKNKARKQMSSFGNECVRVKVPGGSYGQTL